MRQITYGAVFSWLSEVIGLTFSVTEVAIREYVFGLSEKVESCYKNRVPISVVPRDGAQDRYIMSLIKSFWMIEISAPLSCKQWMDFAFSSIIYVTRWCNGKPFGLAIAGSIPARGNAA